MKKFQNIVKEFNYISYNNIIKKNKFYKYSNQIPILDKIRF